MFSIFFYIGPAVVVRYLFLGRPLGKFAAVCFCGLLFLGLFFLSSMFYKSISDDPYAMAWSGSPTWILIASVWSYFILRAKSREPQSAEPSSSPDNPPKPSPDSVESKPKEVVKPITEPAKKPASRPTEKPKKKEPVK